MKKILLSLFSIALMLPNLFAFACECTPRPLSTQAALDNYIAQEYGKYATYQVDSEHEHHELSDTIEYYLAGKPQPQGGNCWYRNDRNEPIYSCKSSYTITYKVTVQQVGQACKETITINANESRTKVNHTTAECRDT